MVALKPGQVIPTCQQQTPHTSAVEVRYEVRLMDSKSDLCFILTIHPNTVHFSVMYHIALHRTKLNRGLTVIYVSLPIQHLYHDNTQICIFIPHINGSGLRGIMLIGALCAARHFLHKQQRKSYVFWGSNSPNVIQFTWSKSIRNILHNAPGHFAQFDEKCDIWYITVWTTLSKNINHYVIQCVLSTSQKSTKNKVYA